MSKEKDLYLVRQNQKYGVVKGGNILVIFPEFDIIGLNNTNILSNKYILDTNIEVVVKGIPKGFIDKKGYRQNYIHVIELNGCNLNEDIFEKIIDYDKDDVMWWHGKRCESEPYSDDEINELEELLREFK